MWEDFGKGFRFWLHVHWLSRAVTMSGFPKGQGLLLFSQVTGIGKMSFRLWCLRSPIIDSHYELMTMAIVVTDLAQNARNDSQTD